jgi:hypothetical protein
MEFPPGIDKLILSYVYRDICKILLKKKFYKLSINDIAWLFYECGKLEGYEKSKKALILGICKHGNHECYDKIFNIIALTKENAILAFNEAWKYRNINLITYLRVKYSIIHSIITVDFIFHLQRACMENYPEMFVCILNSLNSSIILTNSELCTMIGIACMHGHMDCAKKIIDIAKNMKIDPRSLILEGLIIYCACIMDQLEILDWLMQEFNITVEEFDKMDEKYNIFNITSNSINLCLSVYGIVFTPRKTNKKCNVFTEFFSKLNICKSRCKRTKN